MAEFQRWARSAIADCRGRGVLPVLVGGSALYTRAILDRFEFPGEDPAIRARFQAELDESGPAAMHARLTELDPEAGARIDADNGRRIVRALEVIELTGRPYSASLPALEYADPASVQVGVRLARDELDRRIEQRVSEMFEAGFVEEVRSLGPLGRTAATAIGYREVAAYLAGELGLDEARERTVVATRRFARRQDTWWRKDPRITWVDADDPDRLQRALASLG